MLHIRMLTESSISGHSELPESNEEKRYKHLYTVFTVFKVYFLM